MRLFIAIDLPDKVRRALGELMDELRKKCPEARWVRPEGMHITLKFLGYVKDDDGGKQLASIRAALATIRSSAPVDMRFRGIGFFPSPRRPRVVWCGIEASPNLVQLAADLDRVLEPLGFPPEKRAFVPHLTLARFNEAHPSGKHARSASGREELVRAAEALASRELGVTRQTEFYLFESVLKRSGAEYKKLETYRFALEPPL